MSGKISLSYTAPGETLRAFVKSEALVKALIGPIQGGRKTCVVNHIVLLAYHGAQRRWRWVAVRDTQERLDAETIPAWHEAIPPALGDWDPKTLRHQIEFADKAGRPKTIDIQFFALDRPEHKKRFPQAETSGFWLDGASNLEESVFDTAYELAGSWPTDEKVKPLVLITSRMVQNLGEDHWLNRRSEITLFHQPGGRAPQAENIKPRGALDRGYYLRLAEDRRPEWVRTNVDAEWGSSRKTGSLEDLILQSYQLAA